MAVNPIQVQKFLGGIEYPADKATLLRTAEQNGADDDIRDALDQLSGDSFDSPTDVTKAIGELNRS